jgi:hypothetical protein
MCSSGEDFMLGLSADTYPRPANMADRDDPAVLYVQSYLLIRSLVGIIGVLLPFAFIVGEVFFLRGGVHVRGSISAYYHTSMRDVFVSGLCVIGFLLATYMSGQVRSWDFWLSLVAGLAVIGVVFFPTWRPGLAAGASRCGSSPAPADCSPVQQRLGESHVAVIHLTCAAVFILSLAAISFLFARRERKYTRDETMAKVQFGCGMLILVAVAWVALGSALHATVWELTPLYVGEVVSVWAFGLSWLLKGKDLRDLLRGRTPRPRLGAQQDPSSVIHT